VDEEVENTADEPEKEGTHIQTHTNTHIDSYTQMHTHMHTHKHTFHIHIIIILFLVERAILTCTVKNKTRFEGFGA